MYPLPAGEANPLGNANAAKLASLHVAARSTIGLSGAQPPTEIVSATVPTHEIARPMALGKGASSQV